MTEPTSSRPNRRTGGIQLSRIIDSLDRSIPLPHDLRSFLVYCAVLSAIAAGLLVHVFLSAQILQREVDLADIQEQYLVVERQNGELLWRIGRATNFEHIRDRALAEGYTPIAERQFVEVDLGGIANSSSSVSAPEQASSRQEGRETDEDETTLQDQSDNERLGRPTEPAASTTAGRPEAQPEVGSAERTSTWRQWRSVVFPQEMNDDTAGNSGQARPTDSSSDESATAETTPTLEAPSPAFTPATDPGDDIRSLWGRYFGKDPGDTLLQPVDEQTGQ